MDHWKISLATFILGFTVSMVTTQSDEGGAYGRQSYLATAMRFSLPELAQDVTEEEIMKDIQNLENNQPSSESDTDQKYEIRPEKRYMEFPGKRYLEFVGKRYLEFPGKRYVEFPGKRYSEFPGKRYFEFPGKRDLKVTPGFSNAEGDFSIRTQKRYDEFLGKRGARPTIENDFKVFKRWAEFLGKRSKPALGEEEELYQSNTDTPIVQGHKRYAEFIG